MNSAPQLRVNSTSKRLLDLERTYGAWAEHYERCLKCNAQSEWYDPYIDWLCESGKKLFTQWALLAAATVPIIEKAILTK